MHKAITFLSIAVGFSTLMRGTLAWLGELTQDRAICLAAATFCVIIAQFFTYVGDKNTKCMKFYHTVSIGFALLSIPSFFMFSFFTQGLISSISVYLSGTILIGLGIIVIYLGVRSQKTPPQGLFI